MKAGEAQRGSDQQAAAQAGEAGGGRSGHGPRLRVHERLHSARTGQTGSRVGLAVTTDETPATHLKDLPTTELPLVLVQDENAAIWEDQPPEADDAAELRSVLNSLRGCA